MVRRVQSAFNKSKGGYTASTPSKFCGATFLTFIFKVYGYLFSWPTYRERCSLERSRASLQQEKIRAFRTHKENEPACVNSSKKGHSSEDVQSTDTFTQSTVNSRSTFARKLCCTLTWLHRHSSVEDKRKMG